MDTFIDLMYDMILESLSNYVESGELDIDEAEVLSEAAYDELYESDKLNEYDFGKMSSSILSKICSSIFTPVVSCLSYF